MANAEKTYRFIVFSNPTAGNEARYLDWYRGQHIHDLLRIEVFAARTIEDLRLVAEGHGVATITALGD